MTYRLMGRLHAALTQGLARERGQDEERGFLEGLRCHAGEHTLVTNLCATPRHDARSCRSPRARRGVKMRGHAGWPETFRTCHDAHALPTVGGS